MQLTRRQFLICSALAADSLLVPGPGHAAASAAAAREPAYLALAAAGELARRVEAARDAMRECRLCPRQCGVDRLGGERGFCRAPAQLVVSSGVPHFGEEISLVGRHGSGTIFFANCNLRCVFCQNWPIAHEGRGRAVEDADLADLMLHLQALDCHNINLVTPTHVMPNILNAVQLACRKGLRLPLVYNTSGYERLEMLHLLDGVVDIYLPDMKYMGPAMAADYSAGADDYPSVTCSAVLEMQRQVGTHQVDDKGVAQRGLMIRHLVMPNRVAGTEAFVRWVAANLPLDTYVNIMAQYHVAFRAYDHPRIWRRITVAEYLEAMDWARHYGLTSLDPKSIETRDFYRRRQEQGR